MQIRQTVSSKKGSKVTPFRDQIYWKNLESMIHRNSHDFPEIKINSSEIYFSGSEDSPEKMTIISTKLGLELNYDKIFQKAFFNCMANETCKESVPNLVTIANQMSDQILNDPDGGTS